MFAILIFLFPLEDSWSSSQTVGFVWTDSILLNILDCSLRMLPNSPVPSGISQNRKLQQYSELPLVCTPVFRPLTLCLASSMAASLYENELPLIWTPLGWGIVLGGLILLVLFQWKYGMKVKLLTETLAAIEIFSDSPPKEKDPVIEDN